MGQKKGLPRIAGHWAGAETLKDISTCSELNIKILSVFAFSRVETTGTGSKYHTKPSIVLFKKLTTYTKIT